MRFGYNAGSTSTRAVEFYVGGGTTKSADINAYGTSLGLNASSVVFGGNIGFSATNTWDIGSAGNTVKNIYAQNAVTVVSDRNHKPVRESIPDNILDIWGQYQHSVINMTGLLKQKERITLAGMLATLLRIS
jgi:hypothetical protein